MTDQELNRKVAELRGYTSEIEEGYWPNTSEVWRDKNGYKVGKGYLPDYCNDPAAWGALLSELAAENGQITLVFISRPKPLLEWGATIWRGHKMWMQSADSPGRALALAYVASQEGR